MLFTWNPAPTRVWWPIAIARCLGLLALLWRLVISPAAAQTSVSVTLAWSPAVDPNLAGYNVYEGGASQIYTNIVQVGNIPQATLFGLTPGATYFFAVTATDHNGLESILSNEINYTVPVLSNLVDYAVGSAGTNSGIIVRIIPATGSRYLEMQFKRRVDAAALQLQYVPEVSADNQTWNSNTTNVDLLGVTALDSEFDWVTVRDWTPITPAAARFIHLRVVSGNQQSASPASIGTATTLHGNAGNGVEFTTFSQRMVLPILYAGTVSSLQQTVLTDTNAAWSDSKFGGAANPAYAEFDNGLMVDIAGTSSTTKSLTLAGDVRALVSAGDAYRVRPHFTIASLFGTNNEAGLKSGLNPLEADDILLVIPQTQQTLTIWYFSDGATQGWYQADYSPAANQVIYPEQGLVVRRMAPGDLNLYACGPVKTGVTMAPVEPGFNLVGTLKSLSSPTLDALNLYTGDPATGVASGANLTVSDSVLVLQTNGLTSTYFYFKGSNAYQGWQDALFNPVGSTPMPPGSAFFIRRQAVNGPFNWTIPAE